MADIIIDLNNLMGEPFKGVSQICDLFCKYIAR